MKFLKEIKDIRETKERYEISLEKIKLNDFTSDEMLSELNKKYILEKFTDTELLSFFERKCKLQ